MPAGDDDGQAVANFTYPGTTGASRTATYSVCAPAPASTIYDTAVLTVTAGAAPALTVTKSATPAVLVVGGTGQVYTITIGVANGPTTAAINVSDVLPAGSAPTERSRRRRDRVAVRPVGDESGGLHGSLGHQWSGGDHGTGGGGGECGEPDGEHGDGDGWWGSDLHELLGTTTNPVIDAGE